MPQFDNVYTYENIQKRKMSVISDDLDKREGSVIWNTVAANSIEMAIAYAQMRINQQNAFPDTANREYLIRHCAMRGITPHAPTCAVIQGEFFENYLKGTMYNPAVGTRFTVENTKITYVVTKQIYNDDQPIDGQWELVCETAGNVGNIREGVLVPVEHNTTLGKARIVKILYDGEEEEETESLRKRYMDSIKAHSFAGNKAAYKDMVKNVRGVGACKVYRAYDPSEPSVQKAGHVGLCILNDEMSVPSSELIAEVQEIIDPTQDGDGVGIAPINHIVHVFPATETAIDVTVTFTPVNSTTRFEDIFQTVKSTIEEYFTDLAKSWDTVDELVIRVRHIEARLLGIAAIADVQCKIKKSTDDVYDTKNIILNDNSVPKLGAVYEINESD